jgi:alkanesulfonate monooxygenase SsuD/methylene tetrahydromethanopterin reductase-like flavin-dependent oxidoreductase (luciferase family)
VHFGVILPNYGDDSSPTKIRRVVEAAVELGFHSVWATEHIVIGIDEVVYCFEHSAPKLRGAVVMQAKSVPPRPLVTPTTRATSHVGITARPSDWAIAESSARIGRKRLESAAIRLRAASAERAAASHG